MGKIRNKILELSKKNPQFKRVVKFGVGVKKNVRYKLYQKKFKVDEKMVIFESFMGRKYSDNPKAVYLEMIKDDKYKDFTFIWSFKNPNEKSGIEGLEKATIVKTNSKKYFEYLAKAKYIITNSIVPEFIRFKKDQVYVQCWHGTPLKRLRV